MVWVLPAFGVIPKLPDHLNFWLLMALGAVIFVPGHPAHQPEKMDRLVRYYVMTRPLGWWGPVHREAVRRGLIEDDGAGARKRTRPSSAAPGPPSRPSDWTREDWIAIVLSPLVFARADDRRDQAAAPAAGRLLLVIARGGRHAA